MASVLTVGSLALCGSMAGCYEHHTADEELLDIPFPDEAYGDAGVARDAGSRGRCTGTDPIALFICNLTQPAPTGTGAAAQPSLNDLLSGAGTLATLLGGGGGGAGAPSDPLAALLAAFTGGGTGGGSTPSLADLLGGLGMTPAPTMGTTPPRNRDAGAGAPSVTMPTAAQCQNPTDQITQFLCMLQNRGAAADAGAAPAPVMVQ